MSPSYDLIVIGAGLSGLAAGIRAARFGLRVLILERHTRVGGLNSYYRRHGLLLETGLHAMTNFAPPGDRRAPLNRLLRQLKLKRSLLQPCEQQGSEIRFPGHRLCFSNDPALLEAEVAREFPGAVERFQRLRADMRAYDAFTPAPWRSARDYLSARLAHPLLEDMLLLPVMVYGNAEERDMDLAQFAIMFNALFEEGFFRPRGTMRDVLQALLEHYQGFGGELRLGCGAGGLRIRGGRVEAVRTDEGEELTCAHVCSTAGLAATASLVDWPEVRGRQAGAMSFMETISVLPRDQAARLPQDRTIIFFNTRKRFTYQRPDRPVDTSWGVICFPAGFQGLEPGEHVQVRVTHAASHPLWREAADYQALKESCVAESQEVVEKIIGNHVQGSVYQDCFTPLTIERFTGKAQGAVYGAPLKIKDGATPLANLFIAGTDQGFLGIVGAMLSGVSMVNRHVFQAQA